MKVNISKVICACGNFVGWLIFRAGTQRGFSVWCQQTSYHTEDVSFRKWKTQQFFCMNVDDSVGLSYTNESFLLLLILFPLNSYFPSLTAFLPLFSDHLSAHFRGQDRNITLNKAQNSTSFFSFFLLSLCNWAPPEAETLKANSVQKRVSSCGWTMGSSFVQHFDLG